MMILREGRCVSLTKLVLGRPQDCSVDDVCVCHPRQGVSWYVGLIIQTTSYHIAHSNAAYHTSKHA